MNCPSWYKLYMSSESESEDNLVEQAYDYKLMGGILKDEQKDVNKKESG